MTHESGPVDRAALIRAHTVVARTALVPEIALHLITEECLLWHASEEQAAAAGLVEPYWAFAWPGGQALARHVLDHPALVREKRVLDFGSGCAIEAIAALKAGAASALCADLDPLAAEAARENAALNGVRVETTEENLLGSAVDADVILAGDVFYDRELAARALAWLRGQRALVLIGDPSRGFLDTSSLRLEESYDASPDGELSGSRRTGVFQPSR